MTRRSQYEIWVDTFHPQTNPGKAAHAGDAIRFEITTKDLVPVLDAQKACPEKVWTLLDGENGKFFIAQGYHLVNRLAYFITDEPFDPKNPTHVRRYGRGDVAY